MIKFNLYAHDCKERANSIRESLIFLSMSCLKEVITRESDLGAMSIEFEDIIGDLGIDKATNDAKVYVMNELYSSLSKNGFEVELDNKSYIKKISWGN